MKKILTILLLTISIFSFSQTDKNGNPVFNSYQIKEIELANGYKLILNYYTLKNNIENPLTSVFISNNPTNEEVIKSATELMSYNLLLLKGQNMVDLIAINEMPNREYNVLNQKTGKNKVFESKIKGNISENRALEIIENEYDKSAKIENGKLEFNGKEYLIYTKESIINEVKSLIEKKNLLKDKISEVVIPTKKGLEEYIIEQTKEGGELDFFTEIKGKEYNGVQIKPGVIATLEGIAFYKWGRANYEIGVNTFQDAIDIYSKIKGRELNIKETTYIESGFNKKWEWDK